MVEPERDHPLARLTTVRTGGAAEHFARAGSGSELRALLQWARGRELDVHVLGSGSNLLVADAGVRGLVIKLERDLARIEPDGAGLRCGAGARLPAVAARAATLGLAGIEFAVNIPGSVGGAVAMNANAYDGALAEVLDWVEIVTVEAVTRRRPQELGFAYRSSTLAHSEIVSRVRFALAPAPPESVRATLQSMRERRHADVRLDVQEPARPQRLGAAGRRRRRRPRCWGSAVLAQARQLHRERGRCEHGADPRPDGRRARARARPLRDRARAGGAAARRGSLPLVGVCASSAKQ
jgi:UDP-N-acetylenolpyruvoylglucosamine reductase